MGLEKIAELRKAKGMTIEDLAIKSGIPISTIKKISAGITTNPNLDTVIALARALECKLDDFDNSPSSVYMSSRDQEHIKKYQSLNETGKDQVDSYTDHIMTNPANRIDQQPQEPPANTRTIEYAAWGVGPTTATVNVDKETLRAAEEDRLRRQADRLMAERDRAAAAKKGFGRKRKK